MKTTILKINPDNPDKKQISIAAKAIQEAKLVAMPTETVYGLGANALDEKAVKKIFEAKGRPQDNPLIIHIADKKDLQKLSREVTQQALTLANAFWPGPLTLILKKSDIVPHITTANLDSVAIRMPDNNIALELIKQANTPIAAPSANISGKPSPTRAEHVLDDLNNKIDFIIDAEACNIGLESTVIDLTTNTPTILRPGKITKEELEQIIGPIQEQTTSQTPKAPGMKYRHYAPEAKIIVVQKEKEITDVQKKYLQEKISVLTYTDENSMAKHLFNDLRQADKELVDIIIVKEVPDKALGKAIMNRLNKASDKQPLTKNNLL